MPAARKGTGYVVPETRRALTSLARGDETRPLFGAARRVLSPTEAVVTKGPIVPLLSKTRGQDRTRKRGQVHFVRNTFRAFRAKRA